MYHRVAVRIAIVAIALFNASPLLAAQPLTLAQALQRAAESHPDLQGFSAERSGEEAGRKLAGRLPSADVSLLLEDAMGSGVRTGLRNAQWTLSLSQALEIGGQRGARLDLAQARIVALGAEQEQRRRDAMAEVTQRFIEALVDAQRFRLAEQQVELAQKALDAAHTRVQAARAPVAEGARAQAALSQAVLRREHAEHEELAARVALAVSMGVREPDFGELQANLFYLPAVRSLESLQAQLEQSPAAQARLAEVAVHAAEQRAALMSAGFRPNVSGGIRRYDDVGDYGFTFGLSLPIGQGRRARDESEIAASRLVSSQAQNRSALLRAHELLYERYQELGHAREAMRLFDTQIVPALDEALKQTQYAYDRGRYGFLELSQVLQERAAAQRERLDTAAHFHTLIADLERITGANLIEESTP